MSKSIKQLKLKTQSYQSTSTSLTNTKNKTHFQAVLLLVAHGAAVLARALPELCGNFRAAGNSPVVPLVVAAVVLDFLRLTALVLEGGPLRGIDVPGDGGNVLRDVRVDVPVKC